MGDVEDGGVVGELATAIDQLVAAGPSAAADPVSVVALIRQTHRLAAAVSAACTAFDASQRWADDGARSAAAWLAATCRIPKRDADRMVRLGRTAGALHAVGAAWADGDLSAAHVERLTAARSARTAEQLERDADVLVDTARSLSFAEFSQAVSYWEQLADPDGCDEAEEHRRSRRSVTLHQSFDAMWLGQITLDPISGTIVADELTRLEHALFETDLAEARQRLNQDNVTAADLQRTPTQRRADALVEMATRSNATPDTTRRPAPLFSVLIDFPTLHHRICELANGQVIAPGALIPWLTEADIERAVYHPNGRIEVSATNRLFTGATRRALELRDRRCTHPMCDTPAEHCQGDHIIPWAQGGTTTQENGRLLCPFHNQQRNQQTPHPPP